MAGMPIAQVELECEVKKDVQDEAKWTTRTTNQGQYLAQPPELLKVKRARTGAILDDRQQQELVAKQLAMVGWGMCKVLMN